MHYVYVMASRPNGMLYIDITANLKKRVKDHKLSIIPGFTEEYNVKTLVLYEGFETYELADQRATLYKQMSNRSWLISRIEENNPFWKDLYYQLEEVSV